MPSDPSIGKAGIHAELWFVSLLPCGDDGSLFLFFFFIGGAFFVSCHPPSFPHFQEKARTYCSTDGNHYGLLSLGSTFCISYSGGERAGLWLEAGCLNCWLKWKPCSVASAFVRSVV